MEQNNLISISRYWKKKLSGKKNYLELYNVPKKLLENVIKPDELSYFNKITNNNPIAKYTLICAVYNFLLKRFINDFDGFIVSNFKEQPNSLPLSFSTDLNLSFKDYLKVIKEEILETLNYLDYNKEAIDSETVLKDLNLSSQYGINFNSDNKLECNGLLFDVRINENQDIEIKAYYFEGFVSSLIVNYLVQQISSFLINLEENIGIYLSEYSLLSNIEKENLLVDFNKTEIDYPKSKTIIDLFEEQVVKTPNNTAIVFQTSKLSYKELNEKSNQLANYISSEYNINKGDVIGVFFPKSDTGIIALLAVLKLGAVYLPIDINYPQERIDYLIDDSGLKLLIDYDGLKTKTINCDIVVLSQINLEHYCLKNIGKEISSTDLAYIIYTSGSTGQPKGVMIEHTSNVNMSLDQIKSFNITESDKVVWFASVSFDASISEIMMSLYSGATLCIPTEEIIKDKNEFVQFLKVTKSSVVTFPPSYLGLLTKEDIADLRCIITAGESANSSKAIEIVKSGKEYYNAYGPTECAVCVSIYKITEDDFDKINIPIGKPIANTQVYILDESLQPLPIGVTGKIYVSGSGVARGYLNKTELTSEKFIQNPFIEGARMYDTGDLGCWLLDGNIEFFGRKDSQVKLRGYRIELGEIENTILQYSENLKQVAVEVKEYNNESVLVAYFVSTSIVDKSKLRVFLQSNLPDYMIPSFYIALENLPLTPNGKIDRKALPDITGQDGIRREYIAPTNITEEVLATIWQEVLGIGEIGITDNFFELGGHSLVISQVINRIHKQLGKTISFKVFFANPTIEGLSKQLRESEYLSIPKATQTLAYPLTPSQNRLWMLSQLEGGSLAYNMPATVKLTGVVDFDKFEESFQLLIKRHEILRTYFKANDEGDVKQYILPFEEVGFKIVKKDFSKTEDKGDKVANYLEAINHVPFNLEQASLVRASLIKLNEEEYVFFLSLHHIIGDGWSIELLISEVVKTYNDLIVESTIIQPELSIQYKDYAVWLNKELHQEQYIASEQYWLKQFEGELPVLNLPSFKKRPIIQTYNGDSIVHKFSNEFLDKLKTFSKEQDVTLFMILMAGVNALLYRYTNQNDIIVGTPIAGREHPDLENQMGLFLNTLPIRTQIEGKASFLQLLRAQKETLLAAYDHQNYPFDALVNKLNLKRDTSRSALFDVLVVLQNQSQLNNINNDQLSNIKISNYEFKSKTAQLDVSLTFVETSELELSIEYNNDIYDHYLIQRMFSHFENLLIQLINNPEGEIQGIDFLIEDEKQQLSIDFNDTKVDYSKDKTVLDFFEEQIEKTPNSIAIVFEEVQLTYKELNERANQLGGYLRENYNIQPDDLIGLKLERSEQMIVAILGILKSGAAYVPIDPAYPQERIAYLEKDSNAKVVIDEYELDKFDKEQSKYSKSNILKINKPQDLAYVIYTSGTTGNPKGVMIENSNIINYVLTFINYFSISNKDIIIQQSSISFDTSIEEIFPVIFSGGKLVVLRDGAKNIDDLLGNIEQFKVSVLSTTPSIINQINNYSSKIRSLRLIISGGEELKSSYITNLNDFSVYNTYGPTESTVCAAYNKIDTNSVSVIGKPISNTRIYILDEGLNCTPIGVSGKIHVSGAGLSRGYLNKHELTKEKFISNPFEEGEKMYDTGDIGRWLVNGSIEFLGRKDSQVKIRGYRIELGEIENAVLSYSKEIQHVIVDVKEFNQEKILAVYYVSKVIIEKSEIRNYLQEQLPEYMVPNFYLNLDFLPLTPNGKIDRKNLPNVVVEDLIKRDYVAPRNHTEESMVLIWQEILRVEKIGITDNFFELGGHSLIVAQIINQTHKQLNKTISFKDFFSNPTITSLSDKLKEDNYLRIPKAQEARSYPLTASQNRLWILSQLEEVSLAYNMPAAVTLKGILDFDKFENSFRHLIDRHEILRTSFKVNIQGDINQYILPSNTVNFKIEEIDFNGLANQEQKVEGYLQQKNKEPFNLEHAPLIRASMIKLKEDEWIFFLSLHHIIGDGWSIELLISEIAQIYNALLTEKKINLPELKIQYKDYAVWINETMKQEKLKLSEQYWLTQFSDELPILDLPCLKTRASVQTFNGDTITHKFSKEFLVNLNVFSQTHDATLFMVLMAGIKALLHRYTGQDDIVVGTPIAGRDHSSLESQMGLFLNTLAIRTRFNEYDSFLDLLEKEKRGLLEAYEHQHYPFDALVSKLNLKRDRSRSSLFDVLIVLQNQNKLNNFYTEKPIGLEVIDYEFKNNNSKFDLTFNFAETDGLSLAINYNTDNFDSEFIQRIFVHLENLFIHSLNQPETSISKLNYLSVSEKKQLLFDFNSTIVNSSTNKTIIDLFEDQVNTSADNIAIVYEETQLTYKELNEQSNQFASYLRENYAIAPDDLVGIKLEKSEKVIIAILGVLKSGGAYVPIDPHYPQNRIDFIEKDSNCKVVVDETELEKFLKNQEQYSKCNLERSNTPNSLVYVIYTSGTTGAPKGVMVENRNLINYIPFQIEYLGLDSNERIPLIANVSFDASVEQIFTTLLSSATLYVIKKEDLISGDNIREFLIKNSITHIHSVPSLLSKWDLNLLPSLKRIISAGENFMREIGNMYFKQYDLYNKYGPTEATISSLIGNIKNVNDASIGCPISNTQIYILDEFFQPVGIGITGKLYISGSGVARGYLNRPELTFEKFIPNPFIPGVTMYDTGDLGCWSVDGTIDFKGRRDSQIKIRGFRVELGEIENVILQYSGDLGQILVEAKDTDQGKVLVAYFVSDIVIDKSQLRSFLQKKLPDYMVPSFYVELKSLPLTPNGKIDRKALPGIDGKDYIRGEYIAPQNKIQAQLALIWQEVLGTDRVGITDNFFELGGHSLIIGQVINRVYKQLNKTVTFKTFFTNPTILGLSKELRDDSYVPILKAPESSSYPLTASQGRLWLLSQMEGGSLAYNMPAAVKFIGDIDLEMLELVFVSLINHHEILRTYFKTDSEGEIRQYVVPMDQVNFHISEEDFSLEEDPDHAIKKYFEQANFEPFSLEQAPLLRASLLKIKPNESVFFLSMHHIIGDGWSIEVLISEIIKNYNLLLENKEMNFSVLNIQYKDYAVWLNAEMQEQKYQESEAYWLEQFLGEIPVLNLPSFKPRPRIKTYNGTIHNYRFTGAFLEKLKAFSKLHDATLFMTLVSGINALLHRYTGQNDLIVGTPIAGREHPDLENQLGLYLNILAIRTQLEEKTSFIDLVNKERQTLLSAYEHQSYPFDELVGKLNLKRDTSRSALFDVMVVLQNQGQLHNLNQGKFKGVEVGPYDLESNTSKFDIGFTFIETEGLDLVIEYNTDIYDSYLIERMPYHLESLLTQLLEQPESFIQDIDYLNETEKQELLVDFNDTTAVYPQDKTIVDLFEEQVAKTPNNIAIVFEDQKLTYKDLNEQSNQLGIYLRETYNIQPDDLVGIKLERSEKMLVVLLGILKSGAAYVPIDVNYPQQRIEYIENNSNSKVIIDASFLEEFAMVQDKYSKENIVKINEATNLAYVIYTSGTTGNPKGVMVENRSVLNLIISQSIKFKIDETEKICQFSNIAFDASVEQIFLAILNGACLNVLNREVLLDSKKIETFIEENKITHFHSVPSVLENIIPKKFSSLKRLISGGDTCSFDLARKWDEYCDFYNEYGPTETTVTSIEFLYEKGKKFSIGRPISNTQVYILDEGLNLVPIGVTGKIYIAGAGITRGYLNQEVLTNEKFILNPFCKESLMYDTGDLGFWLSDGNIEFSGRKDNQVKIRGYRIELGEIETTLSQYSKKIKQVIVEVKENNKDKVLAAYIVTDDVIEKSEIRQFLIKKLPDYMIPSFYVTLKELPLTPNGKIDRKNLPSISENDTVRNQYVAPRNEIEAKMVMIWQEALAIDKISVTDNFFELGGHSLKATRLISTIQKEFEINISITSLFDNMTIQDLAVLIENINLTSYNSGLETIEGIEEEESFLL